MKRLLLLMLALFALSAAGADTIGWHVVKQGETLEGITKRYLGSSESWRENWKLNPDVRNPNVLKPGQRIRVILARELPARFALIRKVARRVEKKPEPQPWEPAHAGDRLAERHGVQTFAASSAELRFDDDTVLTLAERSLVFLRAAKAATPRRDRSEIEIIDGQGDLEKPAKPSRAHEIEVVVGTATAKPEGNAARTRFRSEQHNAQVMSYRGATSVQSAGKSVKVAEGMGVAVPEGAAPGKPEKLLAAPRIGTLQAETAHPAFTWPAVKGAVGYTVEVCRDRSCAEVLSRATGVTATEWTSTDALPAGEHFWRVTARSTNGLDGYPAVASLKVIRAIAGSVRTDGAPSQGVSVSLYRDSSRVAGVRTTEKGAFAFGGLEAGSYAVVVDSRTIGPEGAWPEQIAGPVGASCSGRVLRTAGGCAGGRRADVADDASTLEGAEHVTNLTLADDPVDGVDFEFSYGAVTHTGDSGQGSLRQFLENANRVAGGNAMKFFPGTGSTAAAGWTIQPASPLPRVTDDGTVLDGRAWNPLDLSTRSHDEKSEVGTVTVIGEEWAPLLNPQLPDLTLDFSKAGAGLDASGELTVRNFALVGARTHLTSTSRLVVENSVIGALLQRAAGTAGLEIRGTATIRRVLVTGMSEYGIAVRRGAKIEAEHLEVSDCGYGETSGVALLIESNGSRIASSLLLLNTHAAGLAISAGRENTVMSSTFRGNRVAIASSSLADENWFHGNRFEDNILAAVVASGPGTVPAPRVQNIGVEEDGSTRVTGVAPGATRVALFAGDENGRLDPLTAVAPAGDGHFDALIPVQRVEPGPRAGQP